MGRGSRRPAADRPGGVLHDNNQGSDEIVGSDPEPKPPSHILPAPQIKTEYQHDEQDQD